jgi:hypothetical protein
MADAYYFKHCNLLVFNTITEANLGLKEDLPTLSCQFVDPFNLYVPYSIRQALNFRPRLQLDRLAAMGH